MPRIFKKSLADVTREICQKLYEANGSSAVYDYGIKVKLENHKCDPCDAQTPTISDSKENTCAICGTHKDIPTNISKEDYILWDYVKREPIEGLDIVYHYTTVIELINDGQMVLMGNEKLVRVAELPIKWQKLISKAIELTK